MPPHSLTEVERVLTIEITHTEVIDGLEYFVFSDADYAWPPLPDLFWGGKKVRLSEEGFLVFRWNGQDVPLYDFSHHHLEPPAERTRYSYNEYTVFPRIESSRVYRSIDPYDLALVGFGVAFWDWDQVKPALGTSQILFLHRYGIGSFSILRLGVSYVPIYHVILDPISANIDGEEIPYPEHQRPIYYPGTSVQPTSWGQLKSSVFRTK